MKHAHQFTAERVHATHCAALICTGPSAETLLPGFGQRLADGLRAALTGLLGETRPVISCADPVTGREADRGASDGPHACLHFATAPGESPILVSIDGATVMSLVDRSFGGAAGSVIDCPREFPPSARHMILRLEAVVLDALQRALNVSRSGAIQSVRRELTAPATSPFAPDHRVATLALSIVEPGHRPWAIDVTLSCAALDRLFGHGDHGAPGAALAVRSGDPANGPWGDISLPLTAVLVEMDVPLSAISQLEPGQIIPVTVRRNLPLRIGRRCIARGTVGAADGQLALQLSSLA